jgi:hypothetical protein
MVAGMSNPAFHSHADDIPGPVGTALRSFIKLLATHKMNLGDVFVDPRYPGMRRHAQELENDNAVLKQQVKRAAETIMRKNRQIAEYEAQLKELGVDTEL